jgi:hypothetical protein
MNLIDVFPPCPYIWIISGVTWILAINHLLSNAYFQ